VLIFLDGVFVVFIIDGVTPIDVLVWSIAKLDVSLYLVFEKWDLISSIFNVFFYIFYFISGKFSESIPRKFFFLLSSQFMECFELWCIEAVACFK